MKQRTKYKISLDPALPANPVTEQLYYDRTVWSMMVFDGVVWKAVGDQIIKYCIICHLADRQHDAITIIDHPFLANNLEMLEWKYEKSKTV